MIKKFIIFGLTIILVVSGIVFTPKKTLAATNQTFILKRGESISFSYSITKAILYKYGDEDKKLVTASATNTKCSITAKQSSGTAVFYICKNGIKADANVVYNIRVYVIQDPSTIYHNVTNSIAGADAENQTVHVYEGDSFTLTLRQPEQDGDYPTVPQAWQEANETTKKATSLIGHECYEVRDSAGNYRQAGDIVYLDASPAGAFSNRVNRTFKVLPGHVASGKVATTYIRTQMKWMSSNGNAYYTKRRIITVKIYSRPTLTIKKDNTAINQLSTAVGDSKFITYTINNLQPSDVVQDLEVTPTNEKGVYVKQSGNGFYITPLEATNQLIIISFSIEGPLSKGNGEDYPPFKFNFRIIGTNLQVPVLKQIEQVKEGLKLSFTKVTDAGGYKIYRSKEKNGGYTLVGKTYDNPWFIDEKANFRTTYYYKVTAMTKDSATATSDDNEAEAPTESDYSNVLSSFRVLNTPNIASIKKLKNNYYQVKMYSKDNITGFQILDNGVPISYSNINTAIINLKTGFHSITIKTYANPYVEDEDDEEIDDGIDADNEIDINEPVDEDEDEDEEDSFVGVIKPKSKAVYSKASSNINIYIKAKDKKKPTVKGVKNKKTYKKTVKIKFYDKSGIKKATLNGKKIKSGKKVKKNGKYKLIVIDKANNKKIIKFKIKRRK